MKNRHMEKIIGWKETQPLFDKVTEFQNLGYGTSFIEFNGHTRDICIRLYLFGWEPYAQPSLTLNMRFKNTVGETQAEVERALSELNDYFGTLVTILVTIEEYELQKEREEKEARRKQYEQLRKEFENQ